MYNSSENKSLTILHTISRYIKRLFFILLCLPFIVSCFHSSNNTLPTLQVVGFSLPDGEDTLYEYHRFNYLIGIRASDDNSAHLKVTANIFLVDSNLKSGDPIEDEDNACHVGSVEVMLEEPGEDVFVTALGIPLSGCSSVTAESDSMSFAVYLDTNDRLLKNYTLNKSNHFIFTDAMSKDTKNQQCIGADGQPGCAAGSLSRGCLPAMRVMRQNLPRKRDHAVAAA